MEWYLRCLRLEMLRAFVAASLSMVFAEFLGSFAACFWLKFCSASLSSVEIRLQRR
jgi:hypothetical protein